MSSIFVARIHACNNPVLASRSGWASGFFLSVDRVGGRVGLEPVRSVSNATIFPTKEAAFLCLSPLRPYRVEIEVVTFVEGVPPVMRIGDAQETKVEAFKSTRAVSARADKSRGG